jgi:hypothetical protein
MPERGNDKFHFAKEPQEQTNENIQRMECAISRFIGYIFIRSLTVEALLTRRLNFSKLSFHRKPESRKRLDAGSSPA